MRDLLVTLLIFGSIPVILVKPHVGVLMWSWISYMNPHRLTWGFAYNFHFALLIGAATILAWVLSREPKRLPWNGVTMLLVAFTAWISFTTLFALYPEPAQAKWDRTIKILLFNGFVTLGLMRSEQRLNLLIWVIAASIGFFGVKGGLFTLRGSGSFRVYGPGSSFIADNNQLSLALIMTIPLMRYLQLRAAQWWVRWGLTAVILLSVLAILGSHSRGGLLGLCVLVLALIINSRKRFLLSVGIGLALVIGISIMPDSWHARMATIATFEEDESVQGRFRAWSYAIELTAERPILGGGFKAFLGNKASESPSAKYTAAHSIFFEVLGEHGFVGLGLYLMLGAGTFMIGMSIIRRTRDRPDLLWARDLAAMLQVSLGVFAFSGAFLSLAYFDLYFHLVVIMVLTGAVVKEALSASALQETNRKPDLVQAVQRGPG